jgi:hypothetical protein
VRTFAANISQESGKIESTGFIWFDTSLSSESLRGREQYKFFNRLSMSVQIDLKKRCFFPTKNAASFFIITVNNFLFFFTL